MSAKILIIDDDKFTRQVLRKILERDSQISRFKPEILVASDGAEGIAVFDAERPRLVIVDLFMPKMDGFAVCQHLREAASKDELAIAVTSGVYKDSSISAQIEADFGAQFFAKPYQLKSIAEFAVQSLRAPHGLNPASNVAPTESEQTLSGDLAERNAATLFWDLLEQEATGRMLLRRGQVVRQIQFFVGHPVSVSTNVREETLGQFLVARNVIDVAILRKAMAAATQNKQRLGETLIQMGSLSPQQLIKQLTDQTRLKLVRALRWQKGSWTFQKATPSNHRGNALDFSEVIVSGLASTARVDPPSPEIRALRSQELVLSERGVRMLSQIGLSVSASFAKHFHQGIGGDELARLGVNRLELYTCLDVLHTCAGLLSQESSGVPLMVNDERSEPIPLSVLADSGDRQSSRDGLYSSLFDTDSKSTALSGTNPLAGLETEDLWEAQQKVEIHIDSPESKVASQAPSPGVAVESEAETLQISDDSAVSVSFSSIPKRSQGPSAQEDLIREFLRIQDKNLYEILEVAADAQLHEIESAYRAHEKAFAKDSFQSAKLGRDYQKLDILHAAYKSAWRTLCDASERKLYDASQVSAASAMPGAPSLDAELVFREAEEHLALGHYPEAIAKLEASVAIAPHEAAYRACLGWALFVQGESSALAADKARPHLNEALALAPESGLVHEYKGRIHAALGDDLDAAIMHLGKALDDDPRRGDALIALEKLHIARGELRELESIYRRIIFRLVDNHGGEEAVIWSRLGDLHAHYMHDDASALVAYERALRLSPNNATLKAKCAQRRSGGLAPFYSDAEALIASWQSKPSSLAPLQELFAAAQGANLHDSAFITASALVASGDSGTEASEVYQRYRSRFLLRAQQSIGAKEWNEILHDEDYPRVGALYALLDGLIQRVAPSAGAKEELDKADPLKESALPPDFLAVRNYVAHALGVPIPEVRSRSDYERMISVAATDRPVILAGYDVLTCANRIELCFRLGRAMSYLRPGRATAAASPARVLKSAMLACYTLSAPQAQIPDSDGQLAAFQDALSECDEGLCAKLAELVTQISREHPTLNLSRWARDLTRTADRVGLLLCADLPLAKRISNELSGAQAATELQAFAVSPRHLQLRQSLGLSVAV